MSDFDALLDEALEGEPEYDADTCVTAEELREIGISVPDSVPDCGWIPRHAIKYGDVGVDIGGTAVIANVAVTLSEPFRWINITVRLDGTQEV
jgi:hypothetical protein